MPITKKSSKVNFRPLIATWALQMGLLSPASADIKLSSDWNAFKVCPEEPKDLAEVIAIQNGKKLKPVCSPTELEKLGAASLGSAIKRSAALRRTDKSQRDHEVASKFKLQIDGRNYYLSSALFMSKKEPNEVCTPSQFKGAPTYRCDEGQRHTSDCHILIFNEQFEEVAYRRIEVNEPFQFYCNALPAIGVADAANNVLLATIQYFPIDTKPTSSINDLGNNWRRMTVTLRLHPGEDGSMEIQQEDACLGNPNRIATIPDARLLFKKCTAQHQLRDVIRSSQHP